MGYGLLEFTEKLARKNHEEHPCLFQDIRIVQNLGLFCLGKRGLSLVGQNAMRHGLPYFLFKSQFLQDFLGELGSGHIVTQEFHVGGAKADIMQQDGRYQDIEIDVPFILRNNQRPVEVAHYVDEVVVEKVELSIAAPCCDIDFPQAGVSFNMCIQGLFQSVIFHFSVLPFSEVSQRPQVFLQ